MIERYPVESLILKTKFKYHEEYKKNILNYIKEDKSSSFKKKDDYYNDNLMRDDWLQSANWERPWIKYAAPGIHEHLLMFARHLGYEKINIQNIWYQQYGYNGIHNWHIHGANYSGVYYLEYDNTCPLTEFVYPTNLEKSFNIESEEGDILFFPTFFIHRSPISQTNNRKSIISWNLEFEKIQKKYLNNRPVERIKHADTFI